MPVMDGYEFLYLFTRINSTLLREIPVIVVSSSDARSDKEKVDRLGASSYLSKPLHGGMVEKILKSRVAA